MKADIDIGYYGDGIKDLLGLYVWECPACQTRGSVVLLSDTEVLNCKGCQRTWVRDREAPPKQGIAEYTTVNSRGIRLRLLLEE